MFIYRDSKQEQIDIREAMIIVIYLSKKGFIRIGLNHELYPEYGFRTEDGAVVISSKIRFLLFLYLCYKPRTWDLIACYGKLFANAEK